DDAADGELGLVRDGRQTNDMMAAVSVDDLARAIGGLEGRRVLVLGASYREDVKELAFSTAFLLVEQLRRRGAEVLIHDPLFTPAELAGFEAMVVDLNSDEARSVDAIVVQAMHHAFDGLDWRSFKSLRAVLDGRGTLDAEQVRRAGAAYVAIGIPDSA